MHTSHSTSVRRLGRLATGHAVPFNSCDHRHRHPPPPPATTPTPSARGHRIQTCSAAAIGATNHHQPPPTTTNHHQPPPTTNHQPRTTTTACEPLGDFFEGIGCVNRSVGLWDTACSGEVSRLRLPPDQQVVCRHVLTTGIKPKSTDVNRVQRRIASTDQHPIDTTRTDAE